MLTVGGGGVRMQTHRPSLHANPLLGVPYEKCIGVISIPFSIWRCFLVPVPTVMTVLYISDLRVKLVQGGIGFGTSSVPHPTSLLLYVVDLHKPPIYRSQHVLTQIINCVSRKGQNGTYWSGHFDTIQPLYHVYVHFVFKISRLIPPPPPQPQAYRSPGLDKNPTGPQGIALMTTWPYGQPPLIYCIIFTILSQICFSTSMIIMYVTSILGLIEVLPKSYPKAITQDYHINA